MEGHVSYFRGEIQNKIGTWLNFSSAGIFPSRWNLYEAAEIVHSTHRNDHGILL